MKRIGITIFSLLAIYVPSSFAQGFSIAPKNFAPMGTVRTGNTVVSKCDGNSQNYMKLKVQPSCYGANLRGGGNLLDPKQGNIVMQLKVINSGQEFNSRVEFPNKLSWPDNYGQTCSWDNNSAGGNVSCELSAYVKVDYKCVYRKSPTFYANDYLECQRVADTNNDQALNQTLYCSFMYNYNGSYQRIANVANCGFQDKNQDLSHSVAVTANSNPSKLDKFAKRGNLEVAYHGISRKKVDVFKDTARGQLMISGPKSSVSASFFQIKNGQTVPLTTKIEAGFDQYEECLDIKVSFLGENQFCGSFYSPLMLFFDDHRPAFVGKSSFPLLEGVNLISWPEQNAPGYFLALDIRGDKKVLNKKQLFGDGNGFANGFEALRELDTNQDGKIDKNDKDFHKLFLWQDKNGNGVTEKSEVFTLKQMKVKSISLDYKDDQRKSYGRFAEAREHSDFELENGKTGKIIDIWFSPADAPSQE